MIETEDGTIGEFEGSPNQNLEFLKSHLPKIRKLLIEKDPLEKGLYGEIIWDTILPGSAKDFLHGKDPITGEVRLNKGIQWYPHGGYLSTFSHANEIAKQGFYSVKMDDGVKVDLTATERVGFHRYNFLENENTHVVIDLKECIRDRAIETSITKIDEYTFLGYRFSTGWSKEHKVFFAIRSSVPVSDLKYFENNTYLEARSSTELTLNYLKARVLLLKQKIIAMKTFISGEWS